MYGADRFRQQIEAYEKERPRYEKLGEHLKQAIESAARKLGLTVIVSARAKEVHSFATKITDPEKDYPAPLDDVTDLCGVRVILLTLHDVNKMCAWVRRNFDINDEHSGDTRARLKDREFGYRSIHLVGPIREPVTDALLMAIPSDHRKLTVELQIRTVLQHAWADSYHDLGYKLTVP